MQVVLVVMVALCAIASATAVHKTPMAPPEQYYVELEVTMPTFPIAKEKIEIWYDGKSGNEYVSYDDDLDANVFITQDGHQRAYQISPQGTSADDVKYTCITSGINLSPFMFSAFPYQLEKFAYKRTESLGGVSADVFVFNDPPAGFPDAINNMTYWADASTGAPLKYEVMGYYGQAENYLNGPNYDYFVTTFSNYKPNYVNASKFALPKICAADSVVVSPSVASPRMVASRFHLAAVDSHDMLVEYKAAAGRSYAHDSEEHVARKASFARNLAQIHLLNNEHNTARFGLGNFGDYHADELKALRMPATKRGTLDADAIVYKPKTKSIAELPKAVDWRTKGAVGPLKEQGLVGTCWSFGSAEALATAFFLKHGLQDGKFVQFSEQALIDCSWAYGNQGVNGGTAKGAYKYVEAAGGLPTEDDYPYLMNDGICHNKGPWNLTMSHHEDITPFDLHATLDAVANHGGLAIAVDTTPAVWTWYHSGVVSVKGCNPVSLDHEIMLVGYEIQDDPLNPVFIVRNSWSREWAPTPPTPATPTAVATCTSPTTRTAASPPRPSCRLSTKL
ncbi:26-29kD-proteinase [Thecamonas trahens ATCC 50062]|uniref:26-29kD-proteinase n=1 Tax=Thecamonas trahens ATCC 50062 TaxID=461836 RepID=A0A0L0DS79_THETB|nr:26-29kD-proteinase [Thecamonas trahens ATCC 50062]KNC55194.1 26-29kD-proteinase [Thecamonas trahens ATCC 50062]|eukprot:XP_013753245.1 26-29kD-proteinase [Thecamonas trahens ATCC 50062]